ncbi:MAG: LysM domain-containing protein [Actinomycetota bacterium]|nr:LysM domain-containing protein [Actinomycetota bacterium]
MQEQSYARFALPALLLTLVIGTLFVLVVAGGSDDDKKADKPQTTQTAPKTRKKSITVRPGDSPSAIAERAGIALERLQELNPRMDPRALHVGDKLKLAP